MDLTGMSEEEYRWFVRECYKNFKLRPGEPVALEPGTIILINLAVSLLLSAAAMLLTPKPKDQEQKTPEEETIEGQNVVRRDRFAPKSGFDSFQNVVDMGSVVPIIYAKQEVIGGETYGGLRVNTNLLWSQVLSVGGGQFFKGLFLVGEAGVEIDYEQIALGNNTLASYELIEKAEAGRVTLYYTDGGGRISSDDYKRGVIADKDPGAEAGSVNDIYEVVGKTSFCQALQPSNQVEFGVYGHIGNKFGYKEGEPFVPTTQWQAGDTVTKRQGNAEAIAEARKGAVTWHTRAAFIGTEELRTVKKDDELTYVIYKESLLNKSYSGDKNELYVQKDGIGGGNQEEAKIYLRDTATTIASIQRGFDEMINVGDLYRAGSAIVVCTDRTDPFVSEVDYQDDNGRSMTAKFKVIAGGQVHVWDEDNVNTQKLNENADTDPDKKRWVAGYDEPREPTLCSEYSQLFRLLVGAFSVERAFKTIEVGLHSNVGLKSSGVTNFNSLITDKYFDKDKADSGVPIEDGSYQAFIDAVNCGGAKDGEEGEFRRTIKPGTYSAADTRFSFFRIYYRDIDSDKFTASKHLYSVRSATGVDVYNFLRFKFAESKRREFRFMPVSSWEVREDIGNWDELYAIDAHDGTDRSVDERGFTVEFYGAKIENKEEEFQVKAFKNPNYGYDSEEERNNVRLGIAPHDDTGETYVDRYARIAEAFIYDGISTTASEPEHKISYINIISDNTATPDYDDMSLVGLNIRSSKELRSLDQLSVYCTQGVIDSHLFPDVFYDLLTKDRYGTGEFFDERQIDKGSFNAAADWTKSRKYFFDGAISEKINLRTWGAERARDFLLDLSVSGGQFTLKPTINFDGAEPISAMYSSGNIIEDTLQVNYFDTQERLDPIVTVRWREERRDSSIDAKGLFPQIREFSVRRKTKDNGTQVSENAPVIQVDLSNFCTNRQHALDRAKLECQSKRYITHAVTFKTVPSETGVQAGSIIKLGIETVYYEQPQNGAISNTGEVTSWPPLNDGTYNVLIWDGNSLDEREITIVDGKSPGNENSVFSRERANKKAETYKVSSVSFDEDGNVDIEALYWPTNDEGRSLMTVDWEDTPDKESIWEIDG